MTTMFKGPALPTLIVPHLSTQETAPCRDALF